MSKKVKVKLFKPYTLYLDGEKMNELQQIAYDLDCSASMLIRQIIKSYISNYKVKLLNGGKSCELDNI